MQSPTYQFMASTLPRAQEQKSFGSFLQKRTASFPSYQTDTPKLMLGLAALKKGSAFGASATIFPP
jgi:hypothetical protein